jgi:GT2 family glycosyltransferase
MISIITAVHNQLPMNKLFVAYLKKYTYHPYELIVIDNHSTDGSAEYYESEGAKVIRNAANYSYPYCQNQGIRVAKFDHFAFLNNDIIVSPNWDKHLLESMHANELDIITVCGIERLESPEKTKTFGRKWKRIKHLIGLAGINIFSLQIMHKIMYGNWELFNQKRYTQFKQKVVEGFVGNSVLFNRKALEKVGYWDERIQAADFDLYIRSKKRNLELGDIKPCHIALDVFHHHFIRITVKSKPPVFADSQQMMRLEDKWTAEELKIYLKDNVST